MRFNLYCLCLNNVLPARIMEKGLSNNSSDFWAILIHLRYHQSLISVKQATAEWLSIMSFMVTLICVYEITSLFEFDVTQFLRTITLLTSVIGYLVCHVCLPVRSSADQSLFYLAISSIWIGKFGHSTQAHQVYVSYSGINRQLLLSLLLLAFVWMNRANAAFKQ